MSQPVCLGWITGGGGGGGGVLDGDRPSHNALRINHIINRRFSSDLLVVSGVNGVKSTAS